MTEATGVIVGFVFGLIMGYAIAMLSGRWHAHCRATYDQVREELKNDVSKSVQKQEISK